MKISAVINTFNDEVNLRRCLESVEKVVDEIVLVDMHSSDGTIKTAKDYGAKVYSHAYTRYVEPARNFALSKATGDWILVIDSDEELPESLAKTLKEEIKTKKFDYLAIPRKNLIFGKWIKHSHWWPDYNVRFFKKGKVAWSSKIHSVPFTKGQGKELEAKEESALIHHNYKTLADYLERNLRYSKIQAEELVKDGYQFSFKDLITKPANEFLSRWFAGQGYKDGIHGLVLAILQSFFAFLNYALVWEEENFPETDPQEFSSLSDKLIKDFYSWKSQTSSFPKKIYFKIKSKI